MADQTIFPPVFPIVVTTQGYQPQSPTALNTQLIANVTNTNPDYTANLPGTLIEDISSTDTFALVQCDSSVGELINSVTPYGANYYILNMLGNIYGIQPQSQFNTSAYVQFTGTVGFAVTQGFVVSDGTFQYITQNGVLIGSGGTSPLVQVIATVSGSWAVPGNTINQLATSVPTTIALSVTNPEDGTPAPATAETGDQYRARVLQAGLAQSQGMATYLKTLLRNIPGVQYNLVSVLQNLTTLQWEIICGGSGDQYAIANAIFQSVFNIPSLTGSVMYVTALTNANPGVATTALNHGLASGNVITIVGATIVGGSPMTGVAGIPVTVTVIDEKTFSIGVNTTSLGTYVSSSGYVTPNNRNITTTVIDYPDSYVITFVNPPEQTVTINCIWNTIDLNYVDPTAIAQLAIPQIVSYINNIFVSQPINIFVLNTTFQNAVASLLPAQLLTRLVWSVSINGIGTAPVSGTGEVLGDPESFFYTTAANVVVTQG